MVSLIKLSNSCKGTGQKSLEFELKRRAWQWIGHTFRRPDGCIFSKDSTEVELFHKGSKGGGSQDSHRGEPAWQN